jgi:hypothetical protein
MEKANPIYGHLSQHTRVQEDDSACVSASRFTLWVVYAVKELVGFLRRRLPCAHLRSAHASLHALLIHAHSVAAGQALEAGAVPHLLFALSSSDQKTRKRAARMLSLLLEASAMEATAILARLECAVPVLRLLRQGDYAERAEAVDLLYLLRGSTQVPSFSVRMKAKYLL